MTVWAPDLHSPEVRGSLRAERHRTSEPAGKRVMGWIEATEAWPEGKAVVPRPGLPIEDDALRVPATAPPLHQGFNGREILPP